VIAFTSDRGGSQQIYVMNADGSGQTQLTSNFLAADSAAWSPDGRRIAFAGLLGTTRKTWHIHVMNAEGSGQVYLTYESSLTQPCWSPDGKQVAGTTGSTIFVIEADGSGNAHTLNTTWKGSMGKADWSPDGTRIVFAGSARDPDKGDGLFVIDAGGSDVIRLTRGPHKNPVWSPDGQKIVFDGPDPEFPLGNYIHLVNADGSAPTRLSVPGAVGALLEPDWSLDGAKIAFSLHYGDSTDICVMNANGVGLKRLTSDPGTDRRPSWGKSYLPPRGRRIRDAADTRGRGGSSRAPSRSPG
jgi:Tol biopolymer transport system component